MNKTEFSKVMSHISSTASIAVSGELTQDNDNQKLYDDSYDVDGNRISHIDVTPSQAVLDQALIDYNAAIIVAQEAEEDTQIAKSQIKEYLRSQLLSASPNPATIQATIQGAVGGNVNVSQAIVNAGLLFNYDINTDKGYIQAATVASMILL